MSHRERKKKRDDGGKPGQTSILRREQWQRLEKKHGRQAEP
jgi:hypothetical protein